MKRAIILGLVVLVSLLSATVAFADHSWGNYHWERASNPLTLDLGDNMTTAWKAYLGQASTDWSVSSVLDTAVVSGEGGKSCKARDGSVQVCNGWYGYNGWLGLAQIWVSGSHIGKAVAKVNDTYLSHPYYNYPEVKRHVLCQEVGHTFGLGHQAGVSCMNDGDGLWDPAYVSPDAHDYEQLETIYLSHTDVIQPDDGGPGNGWGRGGKNGGNSSEFGRAIADSQSGNSTLFVREEDGQRVYTWVLWADPGKPN